MIRERVKTKILKIKKGEPMLIEEQCGIENAPFWHYLMLISIYHTSE